MTIEEYFDTATRLFGEDRAAWRWVCPGCGHVASYAEYERAGAEGMAGFSCIGRALPECRDWLGGEGPGPCNYAGGGLFNISPVEIVPPAKKGWDGIIGQRFFAFDGMDLEGGEDAN